MAIDFQNQSNTVSTRMGYSKFFAFRTEIATRLDKTFGEIYGDAVTAFNIPNAWNIACEECVSKPELADKQDIIDFLFMPDCGGELAPEVCKKIADLIDDSEWAELKDVLLECYNLNEPLVWY